MTYAAVSQISGGSYVMLLQQGKEWSLVAVSGKTGFVMNSYLRDGLLTPTEIDRESGIHPVPVPTPDTRGYGIVNNPGKGQVLNLRDTPSASGRSVGKFISNTKVYILRQGSEWCRVMVAKTGAVGWMMTRYLKLYDLPLTPTKTVSHPQRTYVNLRASASQNSAVLMRVTHGTTVKVLIPGDTWYKVSVNGVTGYVMSEFLK